MVLLGLALAVLVAGHPDSALARAGSLDQTFGSHGMVVSPVGTAGAEANVEADVAVDGSVFVANHSPEGIWIGRLRPDGSISKGFGRDGFLSLDRSTANEGFNGREFFPNSFALDRDGRVVVFGEQVFLGQSVEVPAMPSTVFTSEALVARFTRSGRPDKSFGSGKGFVRDSFGLSSPLSAGSRLVAAMAGAVDSEDRPILIAGVLSEIGNCRGKAGVGKTPAAVVRLTETGALDPTYGSEGVSPIEGSSSFPTIQIDDRDQIAVGAGPIRQSTAQCGRGEAIIRLGESGERLSEFGSDGVLSLPRYRLFALEASGGMIVGRKQASRLELSRLSPQGLRDTSFGKGGIATVRVPGGVASQISSLLVDPLGRVLVSGYRNSARREGRKAALIVGRLGVDGKPDRSFGRKGWTLTEMTRPKTVTSAQATFDGRRHLVVAATTGLEDSTGRFVVARYSL